MDLVSEINVYIILLLYYIIILLLLLTALHYVIDIPFNTHANRLSINGDFYV